MKNKRLKNKPYGLRTTCLVIDELDAYRPDQTRKLYEACKACSTSRVKLKPRVPAPSEADDIPDAVKELINQGWNENDARVFWNENPKAAALTAELSICKEECRFLREQLEVMTSLHSRAVDRVNKISFEKLFVSTRLEMLGSMVDVILSEFRQKTKGADENDG